MLERPELKLSINDYELMCDNQNNKVLHMMSIALNKPKAKLKKFCKYLSVFEKNIHLTPKSIANKINGPITTLQKDVRTAILDKFAEILPSKYVLLDWIDKDKLDWSKLSKNPNAIDLLKNNEDKIDWYYLSKNPNAIDLLKNNEDKINWYYLSKNPNATDLLKNNEDKINWYYLSSNPNAIDLIKERIEYESKLTQQQYNNLDNEAKIDWEMLSSNPAIFKAV